MVCRADKLSIFGAKHNQTGLAGHAGIEAKADDALKSKTDHLMGAGQQRDSLRNVEKKDVANSFKRYACLDFILFVGFTTILIAARLSNVQMTPWLPPLAEDAYYLYDAARSLSQGHGLTIHGTPTNGIQPLFVFIIVPIFAIFSDHSAVIAVQIFCTILFSLSGFITLRALMPCEKKSIIRLTFLFIYFGTFSLARHAFNGMESSLVIFVFSLILMQLQQHSDKDLKVKDAIKIGLLLGLLRLARIDMTLLTAFFCIFLLFTGFKLYPVSFLGLSALAVVSPWLIYNLVEFGSMTPISGLALAFGVTEPLYVNVLGAFRRNVSLFSFVEKNPIFLTIILPISLYGLLTLSRKIGRNQITLLCSALASIILLSFYYANRNYAAFFYPRYFLLVSIISSVSFIFGLCRLLKNQQTVLFTISALLFTNTMTLFYLRQYDGIAYWNSPTTEQVRLAEQFMSECPTIAAFQTGTLGYWVSRPIKNLDGRVDPKSMRALWKGQLHLELPGSECIIDFHDHITGNFYWDSQLALAQYNRIYPSGVLPNRYDWTVWKRRPD